jgi:hypothetical protein
VLQYSEKTFNIVCIPSTLFYIRTVFFISDIEQYLEDNGVKSLYMINEVSFEVLDIYLKIFLYADDPDILFSINICHTATLHSVSNALLKSIKVQNSFFFVERYKLIMLCKIKILAVVE